MEGVIIFNIASDRLSRLRTILYNYGRVYRLSRLYRRGCPQWGLVVRLRLRYPYRLPVMFSVTLADTSFVTLAVAESLDGLRHPNRYRNTNDIASV